MPAPTPLPTPSYSPTDIGAALTVIIGFVLDVLTGYGVIPASDPTTRISLIGALSLLTVTAITALTVNRRVKVQAQAQVAIAQATTVPAVTDPNAVFKGGRFVITPFDLPPDSTEVKA